MHRAILLTILASVACVACGCASQAPGSRVIFLDGAGWYTGHEPVRRGLRAAGFDGPVERFGWSSMLGPVYDHVTANRLHPRAAALAERIADLRRREPGCGIVLIGLSAGTSMIASAMEKLPDGVEVDYVILLSPSLSSTHDLSKALRHVRYRLYATNSPHDALLAAAFSAGLERGRPAGRVGFCPPDDLSAEGRSLYAKVVNLPWRPEYAGWGWDGGHVSVTSSDFIRVVIAPRILTDLPHPLDWAVAARQEAARG